METIIFEISFEDGRKYRVFCRGRNQIKRFRDIILKLTDVKDITGIINGIHTIKQFEDIFKTRI